MKNELTKTKYCKGVQCPKILWLDENMPEMAENTASESVLETGTKVGELARSYFGEYDLVVYNRDKKKMADQTEVFMKTSQNIAEASFYVDGLFCAVDILHRNGDGWDIVEEFYGSNGYLHRGYGISVLCTCKMRCVGETYL